MNYNMTQLKGYVINMICVQYTVGHNGTHQIHVIGIDKIKYMCSLVNVKKYSKWLITQISLVKW
jgi:hypothetical protein